MKIQLRKLIFNQRNQLARQKMIWLVWLMLVFLLGNMSQVNAQAPSVDYQVKAAMVYKFLGYCTWPDSRFSGLNSPYRIWVIGSDTINAELKDIAAHRKIDGRPIEIYSANSVDQIGDAHLVFVARSMEPLLPSLSPPAKQNHFLIVTENEQGLVPGSTINLRLEGKRIGFDVSLVNAQEYGLVLSSRLLAIAISVQGGGQ